MKGGKTKEAQAIIKIKANRQTEKEKEQSK